MKKIKIVYWISTGLFSFLMLVIASGYLASEQLQAAFSNLGFPEYFRTELAVAKFVGVIGLLLPVVKGRVKEWLYAGFTIMLCSGFIAHYAVGHAAGSLISPLIMLAILIVSYRTYRRLNLPRKRRKFGHLTVMWPVIWQKRIRNV
jgi:putative oxidoreductase